MTEAAVGAQMTEGIGENARVERAVNMVAAEVEDEVVVLNIDSGYFFQLNRVGARIWALIETPRTFSDLCGGLQEAFDVSPEECRRDVGEFLQQLRTSGVITVTPAD